MENTNKTLQTLSVFKHKALVSSNALLYFRDGSLTRKHLRYEAKELVRSLQSSRTSLEKAGLAGSQPGSYCASGAGTLGRRRVRQFSPANQTRLAPFHHNNSMYPGMYHILYSFLF